LTPIYKVTSLYLDTKINAETIKKIEQIGFSRIPVAFSEEYPVIIGILLVKSLIVIEHKGVTIGDLYRRAHLQLKVPLFLSSDADLTKVGQAFQEGHSHMAIVCKDRDGASLMRNFCDKLHADLSTGKKITPPSAEEL
jgi:CBS domain containing-hemolysin-like protein